MKHWIRLCLGVFIVLVLPLIPARAETDRPYHISMEPLPDHKFDLLVQRIFSMRALDIPQEDTASGQGAWGEWGKNFINLVGDFHDVNLRFEHPELSGPTEKKASSYDLHLDLNVERILVDRGAFYARGEQREQLPSSGESIVARHSRPKSDAEIAGINIRMVDNKQRRVFIPGREQTSVVVIVPQRSSKEVVGALMCPRDFDLWQFKSGLAVMRDTGHRLVGADFKIKAIAQGKVSTGFGPGRAYSLIQTTQNIPRGYQYYDEASTTFPNVSVEYVRSTEKDLQLDKSEGDLSAGIRMEVMLNNSFGHKSVSVGEVVMTVKEVQVKRSFTINYQETQFRVEPGPCYGLLRESHVKHEFVKEELPTDKKAEAASPTSAPESE